MPRRVLVPSLRRALLAGTLLLVGIGTAAMVAALSGTIAIRRAIDRDASALFAEQRMADEIVALTHQQQLEVYRYLLAPDSARRSAFRRIGDDADARMRRYLFHELSSDARLQVEVMKETHASFEVAALAALELAERGDTLRARAQLGALAARSARLDTAVARFLGARSAQRAVLLREYDDLSRRLRLALVGTGAALLILAFWMVGRLRRVVLTPLAQLTEAAERIRGGDAFARVPPQRFAELRTVGAAFNSMADAVQESRETEQMQNEELRLSVEQLHDTQDELVQHEKLSAMGQMLAGLAHELNNPLGGVLGLTQVLRVELAESPHAEVRALDEEIAAPIEHEAMRARDLVRSLLDFARKPTGDLGAVSLVAAVGTATALRSRAFAMAGKTLHTDLEPGLLVVADIQKLQHAIVNVLNNALDALVSGGGTSLCISASTGGDELVHLHFDDDGPGFANPRAAFDPFYTTKPAGSGTGLGLSLVAQYLDQCGGSVSASNRPSGGARITFTLQRATTTQAPVGAASVERGDSVSAPAAGAAAVPVSGGERGAAVVLVVDDEPAIREVQRRFLTLEGFRVLLAADGDEARAALSREHVDLVISDLRMPGTTDGRSLLAYLEREHPRLAATALVITGDVSGLGTTPMPVAPDRIVNKPFTREEYILHVRTALGMATPG